MKLTGMYTAAGAQLAAQAQAESKRLTFTRAAAGKGGTAVTDRVMASEEQAAMLQTVTAREGELIITALVCAAEAAATYDLNEVGLYARMEEEDEVLYRLFRMDQQITVEPGTDLVLTFHLNETVLTGEQVAVTVTTQGLMTQEGCSHTAAQAVEAHAEDAEAHAQLLAQKADAGHGHSAGEITGGTLGGPVYAQSNSSYATAQVRSIILSADEPSGGENGQLWIQYTA